MNDYSFQDIFVGQMERFSVVINKSMMEHFQEITGDNNILHVDSEYAKRNNFVDVVVYGMLTTSFLSTLAGVYLPGRRSLIHSMEVKFVQPVYIGEALEIVGEVVHKDELFNAIDVKVSISKNGNELTVRGKMRIGVTDYER